MSAQKKNTSETQQNNQSDMQNFSADVSRLLDIVANALYTNHDVFLRELISNAADACDRLRYDAIAQPELIKDDPQFRIHVWPDREKRTLTVFDNGIGMTRDELADHLGTIAKSGTAKIMEQMKSAQEQDNAANASENTSANSADKLKLIGQFGVGFYAGYMVASRIRVVSRKAGAAESNIWTWKSDGRTGFTLAQATEEEKFVLSASNRGTAVILDIKDSAVEFLLEEKIRLTVEQYSDHIDVPIYGVEAAHKDTHPALNQATALWARPKNEISAEDYENFYRHLTHGLDEPVLTAHWKAEGIIEFSALLYVPTLRPFDLYDPGRKGSVKLYVRRVFISDTVESLMYPWLRFVRGVIDSEDLPLNISRETLQYNPIISKIRTAVTKKILSDLNKLSDTDKPAFETFWGQFGAVLKEGLYDASEHREDIFKICRFFSSHNNGEKLVTLADYVSRMPAGQEHIFYISGENLDSLRNSPQLEGFRARGIEVLFLTDTIDDFWLQQARDYNGKAFKSITKGDIDLDKISNSDNDSSSQSNRDDENSDQSTKDKGEKSDIGQAFAPLLETIKKTLAEQVEDVRISKRLTDSPVCLVAPEHGVDMHMERVLKLHQKYESMTKPVLEINAKHPLIVMLKELHEDFAQEATVADLASLLLDQARIIQGEPITDPSGFVKRMSAYLLKAVG
ncbi:MAG: molecular chaperone HtpG [Alphaproteobacteria bacterium]